MADNLPDIEGGASRIVEATPVLLLNPSGTPYEAGTSANQSSLLGATNETAPASDTATSGLNGRLQRIAQRITSLITNTGDVADAAWTSGSGSIIALLKAIAGAAISANPVQTYVSNTYTRISTNTTTVVKSGAGTLKSININTAGASANVATVYDNTAGSGTVIAVIDTTAKGTHHYDIAFGTGLTIVTATGTAADLTVSTR